MMPLTVGTGYLDVGEGGYRVEGLDAGAPAKRNSKELQLVVDQGSSLHWNRARCEDVKVKEAGRDSFQVAGVSEKSEDFLSGPGKEERPFKMVEHCASFALPVLQCCYVEIDA